MHGQDRDLPRPCAHANVQHMHGHCMGVAQTLVWGVAVSVLRALG